LTRTSKKFLKRFLGLIYREIIKIHSGNFLPLNSSAYHGALTMTAGELSTLSVIFLMIFVQMIYE